MVLQVHVNEVQRIVVCRLPVVDDRDTTIKIPRARNRAIRFLPMVLSCGCDFFTGELGPSPFHAVLVQSGGMGHPQYTPPVGEGSILLP
jgi:hypothetical protein